MRILGKKESKAVDYNTTVEVKEDHVTSTQFRIKKKHTIPSNQEVTTLEIDHFDIVTEYLYYTAPELNQNVFLTANVKNWEQFDLLPGDANIYFEGSYAGKTFIDPQSTAENLTISLGKDQNITVERKQLNNFKSKALIGSTKTVQREYEIKLKNNKSSKISIELHDRIPISQNKEIKLDDIETYDATYDKKTGLLVWKLQIPAKENVVKKLSYSIKYPKYQRINY